VSENSPGIQVTGGNWAHQPRGWRDVLRCLSGGHRPAMAGTDGLDRVKRCTCGAISVNGGPWLRSEPFRRVSTARSARLLAEAREHQEAVDWAHRAVGRLRDGLPSEEPSPAAIRAIGRLLRRGMPE